MQGIWGSPWVGLENFRELFTTPSFYEILGNTLWIGILRLVFGFPAPILLAILLNEVRHARYKKVVQTFSYLPHFLSWVILAGVFQQLLSPSTGAVNALLGKLGIDPIYFLGIRNGFVFTIILTGIWQSIGWGTVIYLAAISGESIRSCMKRPCWTARVDSKNSLYNAPMPGADNNSLH